MPNDHAISLNDAPIVWYCAEEVRRRGKDLRRYEGIVVLARFLDAWAFALSMRRERDYPERRDIVKLGRLVAPEANRMGLRRSATSVAGHSTPPHEEVAGQLDDLLTHGRRRSALDWYREFERIHPFRVGNGMVGKILLNWIAGTLTAPFFPAHEFWGGWTDNP